MKHIASIAQLQAGLSKFIKRAETDGIVPVSRNGRTVAFLVSREKMAALLETMELQKNAELMAIIRDHKAGKLTFSEVPDEI
jgi:prevent-host-death family protein